MQADFWQQRWTTGQIGFHQDQVNPLLREFWPMAGVEPGARVLVPLCGKSLDLGWLVDQGHTVIGVELSQTAVEDYFVARQLEPHITDRGAFSVYATQGLEIWCGDFFQLTAQDIGLCTVLYDRAAMIALPSAMRERYVEHLGRLLPSGCGGLLITLDYDQAILAGPPFSVPDEWLATFVSPGWELTKVAGRDALQSSAKALKAGVTQMDENAYVLVRKPQA
ncbi:thiopurine S-methyltransferase [Pseudomonas sp. CDFA 602]|uniref:thiopurine S-methyltransferase n=1 Tax=Pseudomonas californiensis TaxID=2829823 RepID=UPI001E5FB7DE|nr:thiopurine S-methyltransferase [Pseudomonas californiensis]MCD5997096.1 thiopurine S-methyltransferase [Pseudomonas californiensis]MCD6002698.1 thiopurine S-methyltransferase [Pseudomonas californiensis]